MGVQALLTTMTIPLLVAIYTFNYGRWAAKRDLVRGAVGLYLLAAGAVGVPAFVLWWNS